MTWNGQIHPAAELFPMMSGDDFTALVESITAHGLREPVWLLPDGTLLDGRNRVAACEKAGVSPTFRTYTGTDPVAFVMDLNLSRRHLTAGQKAMLAVELVPMLEVQGRERKAAAAATSKPGTRKDSADRHYLSQDDAKRSASQAGATVGVSSRAVYQAKRISSQAPELAEQVKAGSMTLKEADAKVRQREAGALAESERKSELDALIAKITGGGTVVVNMRDDLARALESRGLLVRIDRGTPWGNPFILDGDGDRDTVIQSYADHYLPHKPSLLTKLDTLRGKALGCWCAPEPCHGDVLAGMAQE